MKKYFFISLLLILGACNHTPVEPIIPPDSIKITSTTIEVTATTAVIKITVSTNKSITVSVEYGVSSYANIVNATPNPINGSMSVSAKLSELTPNTVYKYRIKGSGAADYLSDSTFTTSSQLQIGDSYKKGIVIEVHTIGGIQHGLLASPVDQTTTGFGQNPPNYGAATFIEAQQLCKNYGDGYRLPDSTEAKLMKKAKDAGILTNFVDPNYDSLGIYFTSTEMLGNTDWVFYIGIHENFNGWINKRNSVSSRAVCSF